MRLYCNHEEEAASISDEEMVDGDANIDDEEMVDAIIDDEEMVDANIDDEDEEMVDANIKDEEMTLKASLCSRDDVMELKYKSQSSFAESKLLEKVLQMVSLLRYTDSLLGKTLAFGIPALVHGLCKKKLGDSGRARP
ncbi:hypothetical protein Sjap_022049 [Stephania japonica]|uniref:Uncharacterized protein n=1 Tax=Stephania japonica TaxID=461633 RepID=A0AAP0HTD1_9MAGN